MEKIVSPVRWVGGKRNLVEEIKKYIPKNINTYFEPFLGGGSVFLEVLQEKRAKRYVLCDINSHLIKTWSDIRDNYESLIDKIHEIKDSYDTLPDFDAKRERYYEFRREFNQGTDYLSALFMVLNKTAFNGLVRYNGKGEFNSAFGKRKTVVMDFENLDRLHDLLWQNEIHFMSGDFTLVECHHQHNDFVYLDPPYHVLGNRKVDDRTYYKDGFVENDEIRLLEFCNRIRDSGSSFLMSNHECPEILECFSEYQYKKLSSYKRFTGKASSRMETNEILLGNFTDMP